MSAGSRSLERFSIASLRAGRQSSTTPSNVSEYADDEDEVHASCSSHIAAWPSNEIGRVNPATAATVSNSRPADVVPNERTLRADRLAAETYREGKQNGGAVRSGRSSIAPTKPAAAWTGNRAAASPPGSVAGRRC